MDEALYIKRAQEAFNQGHVEASLALCESVLKYNPFSVKALEVVALCWKNRKPSVASYWKTCIYFALMRRFRCGMPQKKVSLAERCLLQGRQDVPLYEQLAMSAAAVKAWPMACFAYEVLSQKEPESLDYPLECARAHLALGDFDKALELMDSLLARVPGHLEAQALAREAAVAKAMQQPETVLV